LSLNLGTIFHKHSKSCSNPLLIKYMLEFLGLANTSCMIRHKRNTHTLSHTYIYSMYPSTLIWGHS
jgi:hypothetical protein